jgi:hypothetical protein
MKTRREATLDVLVIIEDAFELNEVSLPDASRTMRVTGFAQAAFEHAGWDMTLTLTARRKKVAS